MVKGSNLVLFSRTLTPCPLPLGKLATIIFTYSMEEWQPSEVSLYRPISQKQQLRPTVVKLALAPSTLQCYRQKLDASCGPLSPWSSPQTLGLHCLLSPFLLNHVEKGVCSSPHSLLAKRKRLGHISYLYPDSVLNQLSCCIRKKGRGESSRVPVSTKAGSAHWLPLPLARPAPRVQSVGGTPWP